MTGGVAVLPAVHHFLRVLDAHTDLKRLGDHLHPALDQHPHRVARRVSHGEDHRAAAHP